MSDFNAALEKYMKIVATRKQATWQDSKPEVQKIFWPEVSVKRGPKYAKVYTKSGPQTSIHSFVNLTTGDVYKAASAGAPAKNVRGNVFDPDFGAKALDSHGFVRYLK